MSKLTVSESMGKLLSCLLLFFRNFFFYNLNGIAKLLFRFYGLMLLLILMGFFSSVIGRDGGAAEKLVCANPIKCVTEN